MFQTTNQPSILGDPPCMETLISPHHKDFTKMPQLQKVGAKVLANATLDAAALQDVVTSVTSAVRPSTQV